MSFTELQTKNGELSKVRSDTIMRAEENCCKIVTTLSETVRLMAELVFPFGAATMFALYKLRNGKGVYRLWKEVAA